jgi:hypothetical protein
MVHERLPLRLLSNASKTQIVVAVLLASLTIFAWRLVRHRTQWRAMKYPGPPHSFLFGHILEFGKIKQTVNQPGQAHEYVASELAKQYGTVVWVDLYAPPSVYWHHLPDGSPCTSQMATERADVYRRGPRGCRYSTQGGQCA